MSIAQALAMTVAEIPVFLYSTFGQVNYFTYTVQISFVSLNTSTIYCSCFNKKQVMAKCMFSRSLYVDSLHFSSFQSIFSQLKLTPNLKKVLFATALGSVALALTAHQLKRRGRKRKQVTQGKEGQKTVGIPAALIRTGRPSSLKRGVHALMPLRKSPNGNFEMIISLCGYWCININ